MNSSTSSSDPFWPKPLVFVCLMAMLCVLKLVYVGEHFKEFWEEKAYWAERVNDKAKYDVVFCGDSRTYRSIDVESLTSGQVGLSKLEITNKGFSAAGLHSDYMTWATSLLKHDGARVLVMGVTVQSLSTFPPAKKNDHFVESSKPLTYRVYLWLQQLLHRDTTHALLRNRPMPRYAPKNGFHPSGWVEGLDPIVVVRPENDQSSPVYASGGTDHVDESDVQKFLDRIKTLTADGVRVFAFRPPAGSGTDLDELRRYQFDYDRFIARAQDSGVQWLEIPAREEYETYDGSHLKTKDAKRLSRVLGELLENVITSRIIGLGNT